MSSKSNLFDDLALLPPVTSSNSQSSPARTYVRWAPTEEKPPSMGLTWWRGDKRLERASTDRYMGSEELSKEWWGDKKPERASTDPNMGSEKLTKEWGEFLEGDGSNFANKELPRVPTSVLSRPKMTMSRSQRLMLNLQNMFPRCCT